jgi:hypothetical protein
MNPPLELKARTLPAPDAKAIRSQARLPRGFDGLSLTVARSHDR